MSKELSKILDSITPSPDDVNHFGTRVIEIMKRSEALQNPENSYAYLKQFLKDKINFLDQEIVFTSKYKGAVYNPTVSESREFEKEMCEKVLGKLN